jgi:hypothetical protein
MDMDGSARATCQMKVTNVCSGRGNGGVGEKRNDYDPTSIQRTKQKRIAKTYVKIAASKPEEEETLKFNLTEVLEPTTQGTVRRPSSSARMSSLSILPASP